MLSETVGTLHNTSQVGIWLPLIREGLSQCVNIFNYVFISGALMQGVLHATQKIQTTLALFLAAQTQRGEHSHLLASSNRIKASLFI